jgi:hypothetical protein
MSVSPSGNNNGARHAIGRNSGVGVALDADPGLGHDFVENGPVAISGKVSPADRDRFYAAIRSQGPEQVDNPEGDKRPFKVRQRAIDMAKERARRDKRVSHLAFRVFDAVASRCKWKHRYYWQSMEMLSFITSQNPDHSNAARYVDQLVHLGYLADIYVPSEIGGRNKRYLTVVCTAADRTGQTLDDIAAAARDKDILGASENLEEITATDAGSVGDPRPEDLNGMPIRNPDALPCDAVGSIRNADVSTRSYDVSTRSHDAHTQNLHPTNARGGGGVVRPPLEGEGEHRLPSGSHCTPHCPPCVEWDIQHERQAADATDGFALSPEVYALHRAWWPERDGAEADRMLDAHLKTLKGSNQAEQLKDIVFRLKADHESGSVIAPGKVLKHRIKWANDRTTSDCTAGGSQFNPNQELGRVGFGDKVTGADANDILEAVPGSDPQQVRRFIREACAKWTGANGKKRSRQDVVDEVIRRLRSGCPSDLPTTTPKDAIHVAEPTNGAKGLAAKLAALRKRMGTHDVHDPQSPSLQNHLDPPAGRPSQE